MSGAKAPMLAHGAAKNGRRAVALAKLCFVYRSRMSGAKAPMLAHGAAKSGRRAVALAKLCFVLPFTHELDWLSFTLRGA